MRRCRRGGISRRRARASLRGAPATYPCHADPSLSAPGAPRSGAVHAPDGGTQRRQGPPYARSSTWRPGSSRSGASKTPRPTGSVGQQGFVSGFLKVRQMSHDGSHSIQLSYLEVYNETVRDLLPPGRPLLLREDKQQKWCKGKEKVNNAVLFNQDTYDKLIIGMPK